jgi:hypothetical protein
VAILPKRRALIYGDSVLLVGITEFLQGCSDWTVTTLKPPADSAALIAIHPDVILVNGSQFTSHQMNDLLSAFLPNDSPPVICLDMDAQRLTVISIRQFPAASFDDLVRVLELIAKQGAYNET